MKKFKFAMTILLAGILIFAVISCGGSNSGGNTDGVNATGGERAQIDSGDAELNEDLSGTDELPENTLM